MEVQDFPSEDTFSVRDKTVRPRAVVPDVRLLVVVDNSGSMDPFQKALAAGFQNFSAKYLKDGVKLTVGVITTDTHLAGKSGLNAAQFGPGSCYARLLPGIHDGKRPSAADGIADAFDPATCLLTASARAQLEAAGDRTLRPVLSTVPAAGILADPAYFAQLAADFARNALPGTGGSGSERGFESVDKFLSVNEERAECASGSDPSCLFSHYALGAAEKPQANIVMLVSDEHEQTDGVPLAPGAAPISRTLNQLRAMDDATVVSTGADVAGRMKARLDSFFRSLHGGGAGSDPNYSVLAITNIDCNAKLDTPCGKQADGLRHANERWGVEYVELVDQLKGHDGSGGRPAQAGDAANSLARYSKAYDINQSSYDSLFDMIGNHFINDTVITTRDTFTLSRDVFSASELTATLYLADGRTLVVDPSKILLQSPRQIYLPIGALIPDPELEAQLVVRYKQP